MIKFKKSQITLFILLGLVILISVIFIVNIKDTNKTEATTEQISQLPFDVQPVQTFIELCLKEISENGIYFIARHGGLISSNSLIIWDNSSIPHYIKDSNDLSPSLIDVELSLSKYVETNLNQCLNNFNLLTNFGFEIKSSKISAQTTILKDSVLTKINFPLEVKLGDAKFQLDSFNAEVESNLKKLFETSKEIIYYQRNDPSYTPLHDIVELGIENNITINLIELKDTVLFFLIDSIALPSSDIIENKSFLQENKLIFSFAVEYMWNDSENPVNKKLIKDSEDKEAYVGYKFSHQMNSIYNDVNFYDYTYLFDIGEKTGLIEFTPKDNQVGAYPILIEAIDSEGNKDYTTFNLDIIGENKPPIIEKIPDFTIKTAETFAYKVDAYDPDNDTIFFIDNSNLFNITALLGIIAFTPDKDGLEYITITAIDKNGLSTNESFILTIENE